MKKPISLTILALLILWPMWQGSAFALTDTPSPLWLATGHTPNAFLGQQVTTGDFNGDGYLDIAALATLWESTEVGEGVVYVWMGSTSGQGNPGTPANADWVCETNQMNAPYTTLTTGDLNGDGYAELIISSAQYTNPPGDSSDDGAVFVYQGSANGLGSAPVWQAGSGQDYGYLGQALAVGDLNADGYGDLAVSSASGPREADWGVVFVWQGAAGGLGEQGTPANADWKYSVTDEQFDNLGPRLAWGDLNGDGYDDLVIGSARFQNGLTDEGAVFVFQGAVSGLGATGTPANADWMAESNQAFAYLGISVDVDDVNNDGYADLAAAARFYNHGQEDEGAVFLWHGSMNGLGENGTPANADWMAESNQELAYFDTVALGDMNGDGYADLAIGAGAYDYGQVDEGATFVFQGSAIGLGENGNPLSAAWTTVGNQAYARLGSALNLANSSEAALLVVGAPGYNHEQTFEGAVMVYAMSENKAKYAIYLPILCSQAPQR